MNWDGSDETKISISPDKINDVITAILDGKYSWACVLMLYALSLNPKDYIPCRTYNRLVFKEIAAKHKLPPNVSIRDSKAHCAQPWADSNLNNIVDLPFLDESPSENQQIRGKGGVAELPSRKFSRIYFFQPNWHLL